MSASVTDKRIDAKDRLIVALDLETLAEAQSMVESLDGLVYTFKFGLTLQLAEGAEFFLRWLIKNRKKVFLDYKYFDIPQTIETAVRRAADLGVKFLTVHGNRGINEAAVRGRGQGDLKILSVTVLTSLDESDIRALGFQGCVEELVLRRVRMAVDAGCDGVITSGQEAAAIRQAVHPGFLIVTPGIRPDGSSIDDQKRVVTPSQAIASGADYLVLGRPILTPKDGKDSRAAAAEILQEMQAAYDRQSKAGGQ